MKKRYYFYSSCSAIILFLIIPFFILISILIYIFLGRPILFKQIRPGYKGKPFIFYKFRTMKNEVDETGNLLPDSKRKTKFGSFLRYTSIDELPSLFNVLIGDMSIVGPRPLLIEYMNIYDTHQLRRHEVKPGITGWAQINGRNKISWEEKFDLDIWYVDNHSFKLDIKIILITIWKVLRLEGINFSPDETMIKFKGKNE